MQRIVVALDASPYSRVALKIAAELAASLGAKLISIFVEDATLLGLVDLPIVNEIDIRSGAVRPINRQSLEKELRALAREVESWTAEIAQGLDIPWEFRLLRGNIVAEIIEAARQADLISLGRFGWSLTGKPRRLGSIARSVLQESSIPTLLLHEEIRRGQPIMVTFSGDEVETQILRMAAHLAWLYQSELTVILQGKSSEQMEQLQQAAKQVLDEWPVHVRFRQVLNDDELIRTIDKIQREHNGVLLSRQYHPQFESMLCALILFP
jgi:nucleotide-binding universal stress UspA family protein